jgi:hypothetical protein
MKLCVGLSAVVALLFCSIGSHGETLTIPRGTAITIDGRDEPGEWDNALSAPLRGGQYIKLKTDGQYLYLSIKGETIGISSVAIHTNDEVKILHASAGLITAVYNREGGHWNQTEEFRSERQALLRQEKSKAARMAKQLELYGWHANVLPLKVPADLGVQNIMEYKISLELLKNDVSTMSVVLSQRTSKMPLARAPFDLDDDSLRKSMVHGSNVSILNFEPDTWLKLKW